MNTKSNRAIPIEYDNSEHIKAMTKEELRALDKFKDWSEEELVTMIDTIRTFTEIVYGAWAKDCQPQSPPAKVMALNQQIRKAA